VIIQCFPNEPQLTKAPSLHDDNGLRQPKATRDLRPTEDASNDTQESPSAAAGRATRLLTALADSSSTVLERGGGFRALLGAYVFNAADTLACGSRGRPRPREVF
jgi:hypothetical protein